MSSVAEAAINAALGLPGDTAASPPSLPPPPPPPSMGAAPALHVVPAVPAVAGMPPAVAPPGAATPTAPAAAATLAAAVDAKRVGGEENPTRCLLVHNMFDKDEETDVGWEQDILLDFKEECSQYGKIEDVVVMSKEPGGKIYATFETIDGAKTCASSLAGRWFDKRQLRVEFVAQEAIPTARGVTRRQAHTKRALRAVPCYGVAPNK